MDSKQDRTCERIASVMEKYRLSILDAMSLAPESNMMAFLHWALPKDFVMDALSLQSEADQREHLLDLLLPFETFGAFMQFVNNVDSDVLKSVLLDTFEQ